ncbi:MAG: KEOPS complex subunit Pcc1 [Thermofilaceae archaeon]
MAAYEAVIAINAVDEVEAKALFKALSVETSSQPSPRVRVQIDLQGAHLLLRFTSERRSSLRAALNSFLRLLTALERAAQELGYSAEKQ